MDCDIDGDIDVEADAELDIEAEVDIDVEGDSELDIEDDTAETKKVSYVFTFIQATVWIAKEQTKNGSETYPIFDDPLSRSVRRTAQ